jgi:putative transposase
MPRIPRIDIGGECYHVLNRANARLKVFFSEVDYKLFEQILEEANTKYGMRILAYCIMPNHFHLVLHPAKDKDLQKFMQWVTLTHTQRWHSKNGTAGTGHLYQGRYKSFLIQDDEHLLSVIRYVERNPLRANLVRKAENWNFSSLSARLSSDSNRNSILSEWPIDEPRDYIEFVNTSVDEKELEAIRYSANRGKPFGGENWSEAIIKKHGLFGTVRNRGRQIKGT